MQQQTGRDKNHGPLSGQMGHPAHDIIAPPYRVQRLVLDFLPGQTRTRYRRENGFTGPKFQKRFLDLGPICRKIEHDLAR